MSTAVVGWFDVLERVGQRTGAGSLTAGVTPTYGGVGGAVNATFGGTGELTVQLGIHKDCTAALAGSGNLAITATYLTTVSAAFTGGGTFSMLIDDGLRATAVGSVTGAPVLAVHAGNSEGSVTALWTQKYPIAAAMSGGSTLVAVPGPIYTTATPGLVGVGALSATTAGTGAPAATLAGSGVLSATVVPKLTATLTGTGVLAGTAILTGFRAAALTGASAMTAIATPAGVATATFTGTGALTVVTAQFVTAAAALTGAGTMTAALGATGAAGPNLGGTGTLTATLESFVTRDSSTGNLMLQGRRYRFSGSNWVGTALNEDPASSPGYGETYVTAPVAGRGSYNLHLSTHSEIDDYLAQCVAMNATGTRSFAACTIGHPLSVQPTFGSFSSANLEPLDYGLKRCGELGIRIVLPLSTNYEFYLGGVFDYCRWNGVTPDSTPSQFYNNTTIINSFKAHISFVLNHVNVYTGVAYKNDPAILCWETVNEGGAADQATHLAWSENIASYIKTTLGARQLVMDGGNVVGAITYDFSQIPSIDIMTTHPYSIATGTLHYTASSGADAHANGKAWVLGEWPPNGYGFPLDIFGQHQAIQWTYDGFLSTQEGLETDGDLFWSGFPTLEGHEAVWTVHYPGDNPGQVTRVAQFTAHNVAMPTTITTERLSDNMTGTNGTLLQAHTADSGSTWKKQAGSTGDGTIQADRVWFGSESHYVSSGQPPTRDYDVVVNLRIIGSVAANAQIFVDSRAVWGEKTAYTAVLLHNAGNWSITLYRTTNGASVQIAANPITAPTAGTDHTLTLRTASTGTTNTITALWDGGTAVTGTDDWIRTAGKAGVGGIGHTSTTGVHVDSITVPARILFTGSGAGTLSATANVYVAAAFSGIGVLTHGNIIDGGTSATVGTDITDGGTPSTTGPDIINGGSS